MRSDDAGPASPAQTDVFDPVTLTQQLVRIPTVSGTTGQQEVLALLEAQLADDGFVVHRDDQPTPRFLLASTLKASSGPVLLFVCHVDTVPVGDAGSWARQPWSGDVVDGRVWGRGSSDMKGGLAAALVALRHCGPQGAPAAILLTTEEERGCLGAAAAVADDALAGLDVQAIIVPESTDNEVVLGHRGALWLTLDLNGIAAHGASPHLGKNALLGMARCLIDVEERLPRQSGSSFLGATTVNVGTMAAGTAPNVVPDHARATLDVRFSDVEEPAAILAWLRRSHSELEVTTTLGVASLVTSSDVPWIKSLPATLANPPSAAYFTDGAVLASAFPQAPVAIWGPGQPDLCHVPNESVQVTRITEAAADYAAVLKAWPPANCTSDHESNCS